MLSKLRKTVLALIMVMALLSPYMQLDSWDNFPVSTDDLELQIIFAMCLSGMFLVFVGIAKLLPAEWHSVLKIPALALQVAEPEMAVRQSLLSAFYPPLRI
jgi:hypothetical protein